MSVPVSQTQGNDKITATVTAVASGKAGGKGGKNKKSMLSMLAEVASATLSSPKDKKKAVKKITKSEHLTIEQVASLPPAKLIELCSDYEKDEVKRKYTYICKLLPQQCKVSFTSFGDETQTRQMMLQHLNDHLAEIRQNVQEQEAAALEIDADQQVVDDIEILDEVADQEMHVQINEHGEAEEIEHEIIEHCDEIEDEEHVAHEIDEDGNFVQVVQMDDTQHMVVDEQIINLHEVEHEELDDGGHESDVSFATLSASEDEEDLKDDDDSMYRPKMATPPPYMVDWRELQELDDHHYTSPAGPSDDCINRAPLRVSKAITVNHHGLCNITKDFQDKSHRITIPTAAWPAVYTPLLPNISDVVEVAACPGVNAIPTFTPTPIVTTRTPQLVTIKPPQVVTNPQIVTSQIQMKPQAINHHQIVTTPQIVTTSSPHVNHTNTSTPMVTIKQQPQMPQLIEEVYQDENGQLITVVTPANHESQWRKVGNAGNGETVYEYIEHAQPNQQSSYEEVVVQNPPPPPTPTVTRTVMPKTNPQYQPVHIVVDETGEEYQIQYQDGEEYVEQQIVEEHAPETYVLQELTGTDNQKYYDITLVPEGGGGEQQVQVIYPEDGWQAGSSIGEHDSGYTAFGKKVIRKSTGSDTKSKNKGKMPRGRSRSIQMTINQIQEEQYQQQVHTIVDADGKTIHTVTGKPHNGRFIPEWERQLALNCLKALNERTDSDFALQCKICKNNKTFTAAATLISHYRSHAGIKPFTCTICGATFTRQHSLKYHLLIHNNASRFTCLECGRQFRHPSHFKEHLRRHTGETPFECIDCEQRFKTRNTYKRHLRTRHNKLLSKEGITEMIGEHDISVEHETVEHEDAEIIEDQVEGLDESQGEIVIAYPEDIVYETSAQEIHT